MATLTVTFHIRIRVSFNFDVYLVSSIPYSNLSIFISPNLTAFLGYWSCPLIIWSSRSIILMLYICVLVPRVRILCAYADGDSRVPRRRWLFFDYKKNYKMKWLLKASHLRNNFRLRKAIIGSVKFFLNWCDKTLSAIDVSFQFVMYCLHRIS